MATLQKHAARGRRHRRVRRKIRGSAQRPRLTVRRTNRHIYVQVIDDDAGHTLAAASTREASLPDGVTVDTAAAIGTAIAERAKAAGVSAVVFDRGGAQYHGRLSALADAAREAGLEF